MNTITFGSTDITQEVEQLIVTDAETTFLPAVETFLDNVEASPDAVNVDAQVAELEATLLAQVPMFVTAFTKGMAVIVQGLLPTPATPPAA